MMMIVFLVPAPPHTTTGINKSIKCAEIKLAKVKYENGENIRRLISSREQISYNEGFISGQKDVNNNMFKFIGSNVILHLLSILRYFLS